jgi:hypothetical protein
MNKEETKEYNKAYYLNNKDKIKESVNDYSEQNKEKVKAYQKKYRERNKERLAEYKKKWNEGNKTHLRIYFRERKRNKMLTDDLFKFKTKLRKRTNVAFNRAYWKKGSSNEVLLGCSFEFAKKHIESKFDKGMNWNNYSRDGWHIDHIIPLSSAKNKEELELLCHYSNLQPLWAFDNLSKGCRI